MMSGLIDLLLVSIRWSKDMTEREFFAYARSHGYVVKKVTNKPNEYRDKLLINALLKEKRL